MTAEVWFSHMLFADELGHMPVRAPGELKKLIEQSLANRNFTFSGKDRAQFKIMYDGRELNDQDAGSRNSPIRLKLAPNQKATYNVQVSAVDGFSYKFNYPLTVRVQLKGGPLQGALHWDDEENTYVNYILKTPQDVVSIELSISGQCDFINREDSSCSDFAYIQLLQNGAHTPVAKKRFYLRLNPGSH